MYAVLQIVQYLHRARRRPLPAIAARTLVTVGGDIGKVREQSERIGETRRQGFVDRLLRRPQMLIHQLLLLLGREMHDWMSRDVRGLVGGKCHREPTQQDRGHQRNSCARHAHSIELIPRRGFLRKDNRRATDSRCRTCLLPLI